MAAASIAATTAARSGSAPSCARRPFIRLATDPHDPGSPLRRELSSSASPRYSASYRSVDGGASWTQRQQQHNGPLGTSQSCAVALDAVEPGSVYASSVTYRRSIEVTTTERLSSDSPCHSGALLADRSGRCAARGELETSMSAATGARAGAVRPRCLSSVRASSSRPIGRRAPLACRKRSGARVRRRGPNRRRRWSLRGRSSRIPAVRSTASRPTRRVPASSMSRPVSPVPSGVPGHVLASMDGGDTWIDLGGPAAGGIGDLVVSDDGSQIYTTTSSGVYLRDTRRPRAAPPR